MPKGRKVEIAATIRASIGDDAGAGWRPPPKGEHELGEERGLALARLLVDPDLGAALPQHVDEVLGGSVGGGIRGPHPQGSAGISRASR